MLIQIMSKQSNYQKKNVSAASLMDLNGDLSQFFLIKIKPANSLIIFSCDLEHLSLLNLERCDLSTPTVWTPLRGKPMESAKQCR